MPDRQCVISEK